MSNITWKTFVEQTLLNGTAYSGNKTAKKKIFSGSMMSNTLLQNYLKYMNGSEPDTTFQQNTSGSVFHIGAETIFNNKDNHFNGTQDLETELSMSYELSNGWIISGSMDLVLHEYKKIVDWKNTTATTIMNVRKEGAANGYALQQAVYRFLIKRNLNKDYSCALAIIDKGHSFFKANKNLHLELMDIDTYEPDEIERMLLEKTNQLQEFIDLGVEPDECSTKDKWIFSRKGQSAEAKKCLYYCDQKNNCKYFNYKTETHMDILGL